MARTTAVILAAGAGTRLRPFTDDRPKCLVAVGSRTILQRAVGLLAEAGVHRLVVSAGYLEARVRDALAASPIDTRIVSNPDYDRTQNVVSFARALDHVEADERVIKLDGDVLFSAALLDRVLRSQAESCVAIEPSATLGDEEMKVVVTDGRVSAFGKGLDPRRATGESIGIECFSPRATALVTVAITNAVRSGRTDLYYEDVYNDVIDALAMAPCLVDGHEWIEVDDVDDLRRARERFGGPP